MLPFLLWFAATASPAPVADHDIERLTDGIIELRSRMTMRYVALPEAAAFFRRAGPFAGCDTYNELLTGISSRHYPAFRAKMIDAYRRSVPPDLLTAGEATLVSASARARLARYRPEIDRLTASETDAAIKEFAAAMRERLAASPSGPPRGVDKAGEPFWDGNILAVRLICAVRGRDRERMLAGWIKE